MEIVPEIKDSYYITYGFFYLMGMLVYVPYHVFIHAYTYWNFKFQEPCDGPPSSSCPTTDSNPPEGSPERNYFQRCFTASFLITSHFTFLAFLFLAVLFSKKMPPPVKRITWALMMDCFLFVISTILTQIDFRESVRLIFGISILLLLLITFCSAISMISLYELVTKFPVRYYASIMSGPSICGIIAVLIQIALIGARVSPEMNGTIYFTLGTAIMLATTVFYLFLIRRSKFFIYTIQDHSAADTYREMNDVKVVSREKMVSIFRKIKWYYASLMIVDGTTFLIHPGYTTLVMSTAHDTTWSELYFTPVVVLLLYYVCNLIGLESARIVKTPKNGKVVMVPSVIRFSLITMMIFCNAQPRQHVPVYFGDSTFIFLIILLAFSGGILKNIIILAIPTVVPRDEIEAAIVLVPCFSVVVVSSCTALSMAINKLI
ncbi:unnamed protein product [Phaedon cochleariae]|uniref:Uncharacterized protein n=1 Tax=Phaedon cochleariae TaxID=80249 RepID=A0A9N9WYP5_PHACE|nr:unnamed protein product [Phaedon cochleariae]